MILIFLKEVVAFITVKRGLQVGIGNFICFNIPRLREKDGRVGRGD